MREVVKSSNAPAAIGPYSQGIKSNGFVFASGQLPIDPTTGQVVQGDIKIQTEQVMKNITAILAAAGTSLQHVVKATVFLRNLSDFTGMNEVYGKWMDPDAPPARSAVPGVDLPLNALVEIEVIAEL
jgi:2-iminobutanoate/2-iminopropanoate deaminase